MIDAIGANDSPLELGQYDEGSESSQFPEVQVDTAADIAAHQPARFAPASRHRN